MVKRWNNGDIFRDLVLSTDIGYTAPGPFVLASAYDALEIEASLYADDLVKRIEQLEAQNAALLADVNQDEGYERLKAKCAQLEAALRPVANHMVIDKDKEFIGGHYAIDVVQTAIGLIGTALDQYKRSTTASETKGVKNEG